jgi:hypothetical protein
MTSSCMSSGYKLITETPLLKKQTRETRELNQLKSNRHLVINDCLWNLLQLSGNIKIWPRWRKLLQLLTVESSWYKQWRGTQALLNDVELSQRDNSEELCDSSVKPYRFNRRKRASTLWTRSSETKPLHAGNA